ncbi:hypothetical protein POM88_051316 [Heracleum sosnowskyi]|uniref:Uncharacterized protein n=1 Tax=Heracleum sosnowskyi TaxID=360622 RepID=A0AAD8H1Q4_9APIA|nr:hypothetical protein POM88_051316 [Heracleum sosnowskyi]
MDLFWLISCAVFRIDVVGVYLTTSYCIPRHYRQNLCVRKFYRTPPQHAVGLFEFRLQNADNTPRNILEEIIWNTDVEVAQMKEKLPLGVKKASPSRGVLREDFDPARILALNASYFLKAGGHFVISIKHVPSKVCLWPRNHGFFLLLLCADEDVFAASASFHHCVPLQLYLYHQTKPETAERWSSREILKYLNPSACMRITYLSITNVEGLFDIEAVSHVENSLIRIRVNNTMLREEALEGFNMAQP